MVVVIVLVFVAQQNLSIMIIYIFGIIHTLLKSENSQITWALVSYSQTPRIADNAIFLVPIIYMWTLLDISLQ